MSTTRDIKISVLEEEVKLSPVPRLERESILSLENKATSIYHTNAGVSPSAIQDMVNSFELNPKNLKVEIGWKPPEGKSLLFTNLKKSVNPLTIFIYWFIRDSGTTSYSRNVVLKGVKVSRDPESRGNAPNAIQFIQFTATSFEDSNKRKAS